MNASSCQSALDAFRELASKDEQKLEGVFERVDDGCRELLVLKFAPGYLTFLVEADTDTVDVHYQDAGAVDLSRLQEISSAVPWSSRMGQPFGWGWVTINQQGYQDGVLLSFGGILEPSVMLNVAASSLCVYTIDAIALRCHEEAI